MASMHDNIVRCACLLNAGAGTLILAAAALGPHMTLGSHATTVTEGDGILAQQWHTAVARTTGRVAGFDHCCIVAQPLCP